MSKIFLRFFLLLLFITFKNFTSFADFKIVVSTPPLHSIVSSLVHDLHPIDYLIKPEYSPHTFTLKPYHRRLLGQADLIVWFGPTFEASLTKVLKSLTPSPHIIELTSLSTLRLYPIRSGPDWESHHSHHGHDHSQSSFDPHLWLDPENARLIAHHITDILIEKHPSHKDKYKENLKNFDKKIDSLNIFIQEILKDCASLPFIVFHDGYQYFERAFNLKNIGAITLDPEIPLSIGRLKTIKKQIQDNKVGCLLSEPQFSTSLIKTLATDLKVSIGTIDYMGIGLKPGPDLYFDMMITIAQSLKNCLGSDLRQ